MEAFLRGGGFVAFMLAQSAALTLAMGWMGPVVALMAWIALLNRPLPGAQVAVLAGLALAGFGLSTRAGWLLGLAWAAHECVRLLRGSMPSAAVLALDALAAAARATGWVVATVRVGGRPGLG